MLSNRRKLLITGIVTAAILIAVWLLLPNPIDPVPPLDNGGDDWTQIDQPDSDPQPEPKPEPGHDSSDDHGCQGLDHGKGKKVGLHERCDD